MSFCWKYKPCQNFFKTSLQTLFEDAYIIKLFDRSVDLAQFSTSTPLYPICRAWMRNNPTVRDQSASPSPPQSMSDEEASRSILLFSPLCFSDWGLAGIAKHNTKSRCRVLFVQICSYFVLVWLVIALAYEKTSDLCVNKELLWYVLWQSLNMTRSSYFQCVA